MKKLFALLLALMLIVSMSACGQEKTVTDNRLDTAVPGVLTMATNAAFPPYEYMEGGQIAGIDVEIAEAIARELGLELQIDDMEFDSITEAVSGGKADIGLAGMTVTPERQEAVAFTISYATGVQVVIVREDSPITSVDDLFTEGNNYVIGVQRNTTGDLYTTWDLEDKGLATIARYSKGVDAVQALTTGKVDCVVIDNEPAKAYVSATEGIEILDTEYIEEQYAAAMNLDKPELYAAVNGALERLIENGTVQDIIDSHIAGASPADLWLSAAPDWVLKLPDALENLCFNFYKCFIFDDRYELFVEGLGNTLLLTLMALGMGVVLGVVVALIRATWDKNNRELRGFVRVLMAVLNRISKVYLTVIRGTPVVVQLLIWYFVVFASSRNGLLIAAFAFGINSGAYVAEIIRSGIMAVDPGQMEAGRSLGFGYVATMYHIILPQALKAVLPALANEFIVLLKETAVAGYVSVVDLTYAGNIVGGSSYEYLFPLLLTALIYLAMVMFFTHLVSKLERRLRASER